jgi:hypothetical protein
MKVFSALIAAFLLVSLMPTSAYAGFDSAGPITMYYPEDVLICGPIMYGMYAIGTQPTWKVQYDLYQIDDGNLVLMSSQTTHGYFMDFLVPRIPDGTSKEFAIFVAVFAPGREHPYKLSGRWHITCNP